MKKMTTILASLVVLTSCGVDSSSDVASTVPSFADYAYCQEKNVDHGMIATIQVNEATHQISRVKLNEVTIVEVAPVATLSSCESEQQGSTRATHCRQEITDSYSMNITEGGFLPMIDAVVNTGKTGRAIEMTCEYAK
ncbi:MAG: hypothetical protein AB7T49_13635 [Oligoflexales bacterium]